MRSTLLALAALLLSAVSFAQASTNLQLGYQEFPTTIAGQTSDADGNLYFTGTFKGELTINGQVLVSGQGLDDIFWVKTDADGKVLRYRTFGSANVDMAVQNALVMHPNGTMTFAARVTEAANFGSFSVAPYTTSRGTPLPASCLVTTDTSGQVLWVRRTTLSISRLFSFNQVLHVLGPLNIFSPGLQVEDRVVLDSLGQTGLAHFMFDLPGQFLNSKTILTRRPGYSIQFGDMSSFQDGRLLLHMRVQGDTALLLNGVPAALPSTMGGYYLYINTDTSYTSFTHKVLNPGRQSLTSMAINLPSYATNDSVYVVVCPEASGGLYQIDGVSVPIYQNTLLVLDRTLRLQRAAALGTSYAGSYPSHAYKRRVYFRSLVVRGSEVYFTGLYSGINESPFNAIPVRDTAIKVLPQTLVTMDLNGGSKSFVARTDLGVTGGRLAWYGDHSHYETATLAPLFLRLAGPSRLLFVQSHDNVWNPWIVDTSLQVVSGSMKRNADMPETPQLVQFFADGSRLVMGYARGRTAMDAADNAVRSNMMRREVFLCRISATGQVLWYRRPYSTLQAPDIRKMVVRGNKAYFLVNYTNTQNDSNYIKLGNEVHRLAGTQGSLLASVDLSGNTSVINLKNDVYASNTLRDFSFFANGHLALLGTAYSAVPIPGFPAGSGFYLFRVDPATNGLIALRKVMASNYAVPFVSRLEVDTKDSIYLYTQLNPYVSPTATKLNLYEGTAVVDTLTIEMNSASPNHTGLVKLSLDGFGWFQRFNGAAGVLGRSGQDLFLVNNKPVLLVWPQVANQPLYWGDRLLYSGLNTSKATLVQLDAGGRYERHKTIDGLWVLNARVGPGGRFYLSGYTVEPTRVDTIVLGHAGLSDAVGIVTDSLFTAKKSFRLSSAYGENLLDFDVYNDSLAAFAYTAQTSPQLSNARMMAQTSDYEEDAFTGTYVLRTQTTTGINDPLPLGTSISITPNPVTGRKMTLVAQTPEALTTTCFLYNASGQFVGSKTIRLSSGSSQHEWRLPPGVKPGTYYMTLVNKKWSTTQPVIVL